jgi:hypothetical protein
MTDHDTDTRNFPWPPANQLPAQRKLKFFRTSYDLGISDPASKDTVTVIVGKEPNTSTFHLRKSDLEANSEFFARALKPEWCTSSDQVIRLPDVDPALFDLYARWLASGAEVLTDEEDWKAEYTEYLHWRQELEDDEEKRNVDELKLICPLTVWDFDLSTQAWFLGDFLQSRDFQNNCLGHMYYMHLRFDPRYKEGSCWDENEWRWGTVAFVDLQDVVYTWEKTEHLAREIPFQFEQHPLRRFFFDWIVQFWDAYSIADWDHEAQDGVVQLMEKCSNLVYKVLRCMTSTKSGRNLLQGIGRYWVDVARSPADVRGDIGA